LQGFTPTRQQAAGVVQRAHPAPRSIAASNPDESKLKSGREIATALVARLELPALDSNTRDDRSYTTRTGDLLGAI
jgi:hypothetical protein